MKATGMVRRIDDLGRVVIPKEIRRTMRIREGDPLEIFTEKNGELIFKKYSPIGELTEFAAQLCESLKKTAEGIAAVCDRDTVLAVAGGGKRELLDRTVSAELAEIMENRAPYRRLGGNELPVVSGGDGYCIIAAAPIITEGDVMGCVILVSPKDGPSATEVEYRLCQMGALFLAKQMEN